jgi:hypothetical protein
MERFSLLQDDNEAAINKGTFKPLILAEGKANATLKSALWQLETVYDGRRQLGWKRARSRHEQISSFDDGFNVHGANAGQSHDDEHLSVQLEHVDGRLPCGRMTARAHGLEELPVELFRPRQYFASLRPHPTFGQVVLHLAFSVSMFRY